MSDPLIDSLTNDLKPVTSLNTRWLWLGAVVGLVLAVAYVWLVLGPRFEWVGLFNGLKISNRAMYIKPGLFLIFGFSALWAVADLSRPQGRLKLRTLIPVILLGGIIAGQMFSDLLRSNHQQIIDSLTGGVSTCFVTILCGGMAGLAVLWRFWLRRTASSHPVALGAMSGLATASLMAAAYAVHCNMDAPVYIIVIYGGAVGLFTGIAALLGGRLLRW